MSHWYTYHIFMCHKALCWGATAIMYTYIIDLYGAQGINREVRSWAYFELIYCYVTGSCVSIIHDEVLYTQIALVPKMCYPITESMMTRLNDAYVIRLNHLADIDSGLTFPTHQILMCEREFRSLRQVVTLNCQTDSFIKVTYVNYGRTRPYGEVCNYGLGNDITSCGPQAVITQRVRDACQGRSSCQLTYTGLRLWDTCVNTYKYFEVRYTCMTPGKA